MKNNLKHVQSIVTMVGIIVGLALAPACGAFAASRQAGIFPPEENVFGMTYGDWSAAWWQYVLSIDAGANPVLDTTGNNCGLAQSSAPVFFLAGAGTTDPVTRTCTVPAGKALFFPILNVECSTVEAPPFRGDNAQELRTCVADFINGVDEATLKATIDGKNVHNLTDFRVQSPLFDFNMPAANNFFGLPGVTSGASMSDGYWLLLQPLAPGSHVIHFEGAEVGFSQNVTYNLIVQ